MGRAGIIWKLTDAVVGLALAGMANVTFLGTLSIANAGEFDGWCFAGDVCAGRYQIEDDTWNTCEHRCYMKSPVSVKGLDAVLYQVDCASDGGDYSMGRVFFIRYETKAYAVSTGGVEELHRCEN